MFSGGGEVAGSSPASVTICRVEFMNRLLIVGILIISAVPLFAQAQQPDAAKLKADAQKVVSIISGDKAKAQAYCQIANVGEQMNRAAQARDKKKIEELAQKLPELEKSLARIPRADRVSREAEPNAKGWPGHRVDVR